MQGIGLKNNHGQPVRDFGGRRDLALKSTRPRSLPLLLELAKPAALLASMLSLLALMRTAFFGPETDFRQRIYDSLGVLLLSAGIALLAGLLFASSGETEPNSAPLAALFRAFPMRVFRWAAGTMLALFPLAWYLETHCIFFKDVRH